MQCNGTKKIFLYVMVDIFDFGRDLYKIGDLPVSYASLLAWGVQRAWNRGRRA